MFIIVAVLVHALWSLCVACEEGVLFSHVPVIKDRNLARQGQIYCYLG